MITYEATEHVAYITFDRPSKLNALTADGWRELVECLERAGKRRRVAVLRAEGEAFCVGEDLEWLRSLDSSREIEEFATLINRGFTAIETVPIPVVADDDGPAIGAGFEFVVASDLAVATEAASFSIPETHLGAYPGHAVERIAELGTKKRFMELVLLGDSIEPDRALEWGLINRVVEEGKLEATLAETVDRILEAPPRAHATLKRIATAGTDAEEERQRQIGAFSSLFLAPEFREGLRAVSGDREPDYAADADPPE